MADENAVEELETTTSTETTAESGATGAADSAAAAHPSVEDQLRDEREARIRAEARADTLKEAATVRPPVETKPATKVWTPEEVETAYTEQRITDAQRIAYYSDRNYVARREQERAEEARQKIEHGKQRANGEITKLVDEYPELGQKGSPLIGKVEEELRSLAEYGEDTTDPRVQLRAVKSVVGGHRLGGGNGVATTFPRRPAPGGGGGTATDTDPERGVRKPKSRGEQLYDQLKPEWQQAYSGTEGVFARGSKELAIKTLEHATDETIDRMRAQGRLK